MICQVSCKAFSIIFSRVIGSPQPWLSRTTCCQLPSHQRRSLQPRLFADIEELTAKAGSPKKLHVFSRMLSTALQRTSNTAFVDLLTPEDLEALRSRKTGGSGASLLLPKQRRYLILTYTGDVDRVHYPLPLSPAESSDPCRLQRVIRHLRCKLASTEGPPRSPHHQVFPHIACLHSMVGYKLEAEVPWEHRTCKCFGSNIGMTL